MDYETSCAEKRAAAAIVVDVAEAGERLGYWTRAGNERSDGQTGRWIDVDTAEGFRFTLSGGWWNREGTIRCSVSSRSEGAFNISTGDVRRYNEDAAPEASANRKRGAEAISKDLYRRVVSNPWARELAGRINAELAKRIEQRAALLSHLSVLASLGFQSGRLGDDTYYSASVYGGPDTLVRIETVYCEGVCKAELHLPVERIGALIEFLKA